MSDPDASRSGDRSPGMGSAPAGPGFRAEPDTSPAGSLSAGVADPPTAARYAPRRSAWPAILTVAVVLAVAVVAVLATIAADRPEAPAAARSAGPLRPAAEPVQPGAIEFATPAGTGQLRIVRHSWAAEDAASPDSGTSLQVTVELVVRTGALTYGPDNFQVFDAEGQVVEVTEAGLADPGLGSGTLIAGERVRGSLAFDVGRGEVTLLMGDRGSAAVTALRIPG